MPELHRCPFPLKRTHLGFPLGNGMLGLLVWGEGSRLCLTLNRSDFWDHRGGEMVPGDDVFAELKRLYDPASATSMDEPFEVAGRARPPGAFRNTRLPIGRFELNLRPDAALLYGEIDLKRGVLVVAALVGEQEMSLSIALHPEHAAILVGDHHALVEGVSAHPAWKWVGDAMLSRGFRPPDEIREENFCGWVQECPEDPCMAAVCEGATNSYAIVMVAGQDGAKAISNARALLRDVSGWGGSRFLEEVENWWKDYWLDIPQVSLPDPFFQAFFYFALYKFGAATSPLSALPSGLQGPWCEEYQMPPWSADYHFNVNIQEIYALAFPAGKPAHLLPLFDMLGRCEGVFRENARRMMGISDGLLISHTTDDRGYACGGVGTGACIDHAVSGWTAQLYWHYYKYTGDSDFLRDRAMPFMAGVMRVYEEMLEWDGDTPRLPISISAEYAQPLPAGGRQRVGPSASYQLACIHMLATALIEGAASLSESPRQAWIEIRESLPRWTLVGKDGGERIAIWEGLDLEISHRHHSHLASIYPFDSLGERSPLDQQIVSRSLDRWLEVGMSDWSEWCLPWAAIIQAREGYQEGPCLLLKIFCDLFLNEGFASVYQPRYPGFTLHGMKRITGPLEGCEIMQLDGTMGFATAVFEMLAHSHGGVIRFFPAVPLAWRDVQFSRVCLPGGLKASGCKTNGEIASIRLEGSQDCQVLLDVPGYDSLALVRNGERTVNALPLKLHLMAGEWIEGKPRHSPGAFPLE